MYVFLQNLSTMNILDLLYLLHVVLQFSPVNPLRIVFMWYDWIERRYKLSNPNLTTLIGIDYVDHHFNNLWLHTKYILPPFQNKSYVWWNISQTSPNKLECFQKQCKCCYWWTTKSHGNLHLFNNWYLNLTTSTHINAVLCALVPSAQNDGLPVKLAPKVFNFTMDTPSSPESA